jgi:hypothetical protein
VTIVAMKTQQYFPFVLFFVVYVAVNNTKVFSFAVEMHGFLLHRCRAAKYIEML